MPTCQSIENAEELTICKQETSILQLLYGIQEGARHLHQTEDRAKQLASFPGEYRRTPSRQPKAKPVAGINALFESYGFSGRCCSLL